VLADWLIATFWIHGTGYPTVEHANWIIYFASLAMIGRLPFLVSDAAGDAGRRDPMSVRGSPAQPT
jgi:hypothetical protein